MWLIFGGVVVAGGVLGWLKLGVPLYRMLEVHDDMSGLASELGPAEFAVPRTLPTMAISDAGAVSGDLQRLARSVGKSSRTGLPARAKQSEAVSTERDYDRVSDR
jgi:hypothetical protein